MTRLSDTASPSPRSGRLMHLAVAGAALLMVAGGVAFYFASLKAGARSGTAGEDAMTVTLRDGACSPNALTVPAGRSSFKIVNATDRVVEWEILDGVMVIEERENIAPGLSRTLSARLDAGEYAITCGLLGNPRGTLVVTPSAASAGAGKSPLVAFIGPLAEYQVYLAMQANELTKAVSALDAAIRSGDLDRARDLYAAARAPYLRIDAVASRFADLDNAIDPVAAYLEKREDDPAFTGFHRIEYGLFSKGGGDLAPVSARLAADVAALKNRLRAVRLTPDDMTAGAVRLLTRLADTGVPMGEEFYAKTDLAAFEAELAGVRKIVTLLKPVAVRAAPEQVAAVETELASAEAAVGAMRGPDGFPSYDSVGTDRREGLATTVRSLADAINRMSEAAGLGQGGA